MNRPRPSVLQLFDPLSAQSSDSDKENSFPDTDFFTPTYVKHPNPVRLTRRLVEVGDVTVEEGGEDEKSYGEDEEADEEDENETIQVRAQPPSSPRTPLADVTFDRERTPMRSKMYKRKAHAGEVSNPASDDYAFASLLDAVDATLGGLYAAPSVVICPPEESDSSPDGNTDTLSTSLVTLSLATPTGSLIADTTMVFPTPSNSEASPSLLVPVVHPTHTMASFNADFSSADLHSSFALQMNTSCETSFDLLNDRISFLGNGYEESFDMGRDLDPTSEKQDLEEAGENSESENVYTEPCLDVSSANEAVKSHDSNPPPAVPLARRSDVAQESSNTVSQHLDVSAIPVQAAMAPPPHPVFSAPPVKPSLPTPALLATLPEPPALIPALKIVKRKRPETTTVSEKIHSALTEPDPPATNKSASALVQSTGQYVMEGPGPRRIPISSHHKEKEPAAAKPQKPVAGSTLSGPRRVPLRSTSPITGVAATPTAADAPSHPQTTAVKRPLRTASGNGSAASGLPRAVSASRLPMLKSKIQPPTAGTGLPRRKAVG